MTYTKEEAKDRFAAIKQDLDNGLISAPEAETQRSYVEQRLNGTPDAHTAVWNDPEKVPVVELVDDTFPREDVLDPGKPPRVRKK